MFTIHDNNLGITDGFITMSNDEERYQDIVIQEEIDVWVEFLHADTNNDGGEDETE